MIKYTENPKEYRRQYYLKNKERWLKYWATADSRREYAGVKNNGKSKFYYHKKHKDWNNKPEGYYKNLLKKCKSIWSKNNPAKNKLYRQRRKCLKKNGGYISIKIIQSIYEDNIKEFGTLTCIYCISPILFGEDTLEHIKPLSRGGTNDALNLAIACGHCNNSKNNKLIEEWFPTDVSH